MPALPPCAAELQRARAQARKGEVLVRVSAASVNPADYHLQSGRLRPFIPALLPLHAWSVQ